MENISHTPLLSLVVVLAVIAYVVYRQIKPRKLSKKNLIIFPGILLYFIITSIPSFHPSPTKMLEIALSSIVSITLGLLACQELSVYKGATGKAMAKGSWTYFLWWLAAFIIKSVLSVVFGDSSVNSASQLEIVLPVFFLMITRNAYLYWKTTTLGLVLH